MGQLRARVNLELVNEFARNDEVLLGVRSAGSGHGSLSSQLVHHLLMQHDQRFARSNDLLFLLFNQLQRHGSDVR